ncbi:MAG TPA: porin family protein [Rhodobacteraceae bacterium]|nr:porin family protein [Paracoccaceae bacterium]
MLATTALAGSPLVVIPQESVVATPLDAATTWGGFYVGGLYSSYNSTDTFTEPMQGDMNDHNIGVFAGYNYQRGAMVFGGEVAYAVGDYYVHQFLSGDVSVLDLKARVGYALSNAAMVYGFGGFTIMQIDTNGAPTANGGGLNYGAGVAYQFNSGLLLGLEYIARDIGGSGYAGGESLTANAIEARIGWQF